MSLLRGAVCFGVASGLSTSDGASVAGDLAITADAPRLEWWGGEYEQTPRVQDATRPSAAPDRGIHPLGAMPCPHLPPRPPRSLRSLTSTATSPGPASSRCFAWHAAGAKGVLGQRLPQAHLERCAGRLGKYFRRRSIRSWSSYEGRERRLPLDGRSARKTPLLCNDKHERHLCY